MYWYTKSIEIFRCFLCNLSVYFFLSSYLGPAKKVRSAVMKHRFLLQQETEVFFVG